MSLSSSNVNMLKDKVVECNASFDEKMENEKSMEVVKELLMQKALLKAKENYSNEVDQQIADHIQMIDDHKSLYEMYPSLLNDQTNLYNDVIIQNETVIKNLHESFKDVQCILQTADIHIEDMKLILKLLDIKELQEKLTSIIQLM